MSDFFERPENPQPQPDGIGGPAAEGVPFVLTRKIKAELAARGFTPEQIRNMTPGQARLSLEGALEPGPGGPGEKSASQESSTNNEPRRPAAPLPIKANGAISVREFLLAVAPFPADNEEGFITIHWKYPGKGNPFLGKACKTVEDAVKQVARLQHMGCDIWFGLSRQRRSDGIRDRANATGMGSLFVDADIDPDNPPNVSQTIVAILRLCMQFRIPRPSLIVFSGGGLHVYWLSDRALSVEDWQPYANGLKAAMQSAGLKIKDVGVTGDAARVLRVPSTLNYKYDPPRKVSLLATTYVTGERYDFAKVFAPLLALAPVSKTARKKLKLAPVADAFKHLEAKPLGEGIEDYPPLPVEPILAGCGFLREAFETGGVDQTEPLWKLALNACVFLKDGENLIHAFSEAYDGYDHKATEAKFDRARQDKEALGLGWPLCQTICDHGSEPCLTCPRLALGKSPLNLGLLANQDPSPKGAEDDNDKIIAKWNEQHAHVLAGGKSAVLQEFKTPEGYTDFKLLSSATFHEWNAEHQVEVVFREGDKVKLIMVAETKFWIAHPRRRKYQDIGFFPGREVPDYYNLWRGFAVEPRQGDCSKFLAHVRDNVCQGDDALYAWVMAWFADIFQRPGVKCGTSLVLRGKQGVGKTKIGEVMEGLLGVHYKLVADPRFVTGQFNSHMISLLLLHADEGFWAGDKKAEGKLKDLVTGKKHPIEFKRVDAFWVDNYVRLLVAGNQDWQVPAGFDERRFAVLDVGEAHKQDHAYFAAIDAEMAAGGREALLYHLLHEVDCSKVNLRQIPHTTALLEQKLETANPEQKWWLDILRRGVLPGYHFAQNVMLKAMGTQHDEITLLPNETPSEVLYDDYIEHAKKQGVSRRVIETQIGRFLQKVTGPGLRRNKRIYPTKDHYGICSSKRGLVALSKCRQAFAALINEKLTWEETDGEWG